MDTEEICKIAGEYAMKMAKDERFGCPADIVICCGIMKYASEKALTDSIQKFKNPVEEFFE